jgi:transcriptional regulator with XRE-family HTH domain
MKSYFSKNLKALRKYHNTTLEELSEAIDVSKSAISDYENDKFSPSLFIVRKISDHFKVSIDFLEFSEITEFSLQDSYDAQTESAAKTIFSLKETLDLTEKQKQVLSTDLRLQKQKVEGLQLQLKLQEQLKESKLSEIILLKTQIGLLEDKIRLMSIV